MAILQKIYAYQNGRFLWILMAITTIFLVLIAHNFFQIYLFMQPCEQCVYIRYAMLVMALGGIIAALYPSNATKIIGYTLGIYGCIVGIEYCLTLNAIHTAISLDNPFAKTPNCKNIPVYPFNLPLHKLSPSLFLPTGTCGIDAPLVPEDMYESLSSIQKFFVGTNEGYFEDGLYSQGWYLIPSKKFMNMAIACLICFLCCLVVLFLMLIGYFFADKKLKTKSLAIIIFGVLALYFIGNAIKEYAINNNLIFV